MRDGLESLLQKEPTFEVVGVAGDGREAVRLTGQLRPDVLILEIGMPEMNGIDVTLQVSRAFPAVKILGLSVHTDPFYIKHMIQNGAAGYLCKNCTAEELFMAIHAVVSGRSHICKSLESTLTQGFVGGEAHDGVDPIGPLSTRERQVLQLMAEGHSVKESAIRLDCRPKTVEVHRKRIRKKLRIFSIAELTKYAIRTGITNS